MAYVPINRPVRVAADLKASVFEDVDINLFELYVASVGGTAPGLIEGRTFRRCRLQGPAIVLVSAGVTFYALLAIFPAITALVSLYGLAADRATLSQHVAALSDVVPQGGLDIQVR